MKIFTLEGLDYIVLSSIALLRQQMALDKLCPGEPCVIWLEGNAAPVYWSPSLDSRFLAA